MARNKAATPAAQAAARIRDRIREFKRVPAAQLEVNPKNWRTHPMAQREAMNDVLEEIGMADALIVYPVGNGRYRLIDGHLRKDLLDDQDVPVLVTDLTEAEADKLLLVLDPLGMMAGADAGKTRDLLAQMDFTGEGVKDLLDSIGRDYGKILPPESQKAVEDEFAERDEWKPPTEALEMYELREAQIFPSSNKWGIPDLRTDRLCSTYPTKVFAGDREQMPKTKEECDQFLFLCGNSVTLKPAGGYLGFYVFDEKFEKVWEKAVDFVHDLHRLQWTGIVAPDFSLFGDDPPVVQLWQVYRTRWVARYWQELGYNVIPNIQGIRDWFGLGPGGGLPIGIDLVSLQCRTNGTHGTLEDTAYLSLFAKQVDELKPKAVLVYGGAHHKQEVASRFPKGPEYILLPSYINERNAHLRNKMPPEARRRKKVKKTKE